jgi:hypothetical protein
MLRSSGSVVSSIYGNLPMNPVFRRHDSCDSSLGLAFTYGRTKMMMIRLNRVNVVRLFRDRPVIDTIDVPNVSAESFFEQYVAQRRPVVLRDVLTDKAFRAPQKWSMPTSKKKPFV